VEIKGNAKMQDRSLSQSSQCYWLGNRAQGLWCFLNLGRMPPEKKMIY